MRIQEKQMKDTQQMSNAKRPGCLVYIGDEILPSYTTQEGRYYTTNVYDYWICGFCFSVILSSKGDRKSSEWALFEPQES